MTQDDETVMRVALTAMYSCLDGGDVAAAEGRLLDWADAQADPRLALLHLVLAYQGMAESLLVDAYGGREGAEAVLREQLVFLSDGGTLNDIAAMLDGDSK